MKTILLLLLISLCTTSNSNANAVSTNINKTNDTLICSESNTYSTSPYGYFSNFEGKVKDTKIEFKFGYVNTNRLTIDTIKLYFIIKNEMGETCGNGYFVGNGPIKENYIGKYKQGHEMYVEYGNNSKIEITSVVITYTDGTKKFLDKKSIMYN